MTINHVLLIETASNQLTIFQTNRLRENIGASDLIHRVGARFVEEEITRHGLVSRATVGVATSGKAIVGTDTEATAEGIIAAVTRRALIECPGVVTRGAHCPVKSQTVAALEEAIKAVHVRVATIASELPAPNARFSRLPFVEECSSSGYPATAPHPDKNLRGAVSPIVLAKRSAYRPAWQRITKAVQRVALYKGLADFEHEPELSGNWRAIVHADGNGLGAVFAKFSEEVKSDNGVHYLRAMRKFSDAIDTWSKSAAETAMLEIWGEELKERAADGTAGGKRRRVPVLPVVLGGDDLTVICEGERAVPFAAAYLRAFEAQTENGLRDGLGGLLPGRKGQKFAAAAGIAIVKPHFPFHQAYALAEQLTRSAKAPKDKVKDTPCSALDFHVLFDSSGADLADIRGRMTTRDGKARLTMRPYVATPADNLPAGAGGDWARRRLYSADCSTSHPTLIGAARALLTLSEERAGDEQALPRSQAHALQRAAYESVPLADGLLRQIAHRYDRFEWSGIAVGQNNARSLFVEDDDKMAPYLLDAMELADLAGTRLVQLYGARDPNNREPKS